MALYAFLMELHNDTELSAPDEKRMVIISEIGGAMSMISCVMVFGLLCILPIKNDGLFITGNMCLVVMAAQISFLGSEKDGYPDQIMCKIATCVLHYCFTCLHFASLSYAIHLLSKFGYKFLQACQCKTVYIATIWLVPAVIVTITVILKHDLYGSGTRCWLPFEEKTRLAFLVPLALIQMVNYTLYFMIIRARIIYDITKDLPRRVIIKHVCISSLSMIPVLGLLWIFGFAVTFNGPLFFKYLYVVLASGQGVLILTCHVIPNSRIQKALCTKIKEKRHNDNNDDDDDDPSTDAAVTMDSKIENGNEKEKDS
ncbi:hypothetical protein ACF0H5_005935 [Mactra antiquata]